MFPRLLSATRGFNSMKLHHIMTERVVRDHLYCTFRNNRIRLGGPIASTLKSSDLPLLDFFGWEGGGFAFKSLCTTRPSIQKCIWWPQISTTAATIHETLAIYQHIRQSMSCHSHVFIPVHGRNFLL